MKNFVLPYLLAQASAAEVKHKEAMRADRAMDKLTKPVLTAVVEAPAGTWTNTYIGDTTAGVQKDCSSTAVTAIDDKITKANTALGVLEKAQLATLATSENALMIAAKTKLDKDNKDVDTKQKSTTLIANIKKDNEAQNVEYEYKNKWVIAYRAMEAAKAASSAASIASGKANTAESEAVTKVSDLATNKAKAITHHTAEKKEYDDDLKLRDAYKAKWDCYKKQIGATATNHGYDAAGTICSTVGKCRRDNTAKDMDAALDNAADTSKNTEALCQSKCTADAHCAAAEWKSTPTASCITWKYDKAEGMYTGDGTPGYACYQRGTGAGWQAKYDTAWAAYKTAFMNKEFANSNMLVERDALVAFRAVIVAAEKDVEWIRYAHGPSSLAGMTEGENAATGKF